MTTSWDEASRCPRGDGFTGKVESRKALPSGGQMVTLVCPGDNCEYHEMGWVVQIRPDNTIPDKLDVNTRERSFAPTAVSHQRRAQVMRALEEQAASEMKPGTEVRPY
jgi:hypothetical protein